MTELRYTLRALAKSPGFTFVAVLTLALGIGANTAIYSVFDRALVRSLPVEDPDRLVQVVTGRDAGRVNYNLSYAAYAELREQSDVFASVLAHTSQPLALRSEAGVERVDGAQVSSSFFATLGLEPTLGRWFLPEEDIVGSPLPVVVLSHGLWQRRFGSRPGIVGTQIRLNEQPFTVIGVAPQSFTGFVRGSVEDVWIPVTALPELGSPRRFTSAQVSWLNVFARLRESLPLAQAEAAMAVLDNQLIAAGLRSTGEHTTLRDGSQGLTYRVSNVSGAIRLLLAVVAAVLLIAAANIANLLLARANTRRREIAIRLALGASRGRLVRQLLGESMVLALLGGIAGLGVAAWTTDLLLSFRPAGGEALHLGGDLDARVLWFTAALSLGTGVLFGLAPALRAAHPDLVGSIKEGRLGLRGALVVTQVAASLVLLTGAGLFLRSLRNLQEIDPGYAAEGAILGSIDLEPRGYDPDRAVQFYDRLLERLAATTGVEAATLARTVTPNPGGSRWDGVFLDGFTATEENPVGFDVNYVGPHYFETLSIPVLLGRGIEPGDRRGTPRVAVINQTMAQRYWPGQDPLGRRILLDTTAGAPTFQIVGVVADGKYRDLREAPTNNVYYAALQSFQPAMTLVVRGPGPPNALIAAARTVVREIDPGLPLYNVATLKSHLQAATSPERMLASLVTAFGVLALLLASLGLYGVIAFVVAGQTREIGLRVALGARPGEVVLLFLRRGGGLVALGGLIGLVAVTALAPRAAALLYEVGPRDPAIVTGAAGVLLLVALVAAYVPARRAARVDPMVALRYE